MLTTDCPLCAGTATINDDLTIVDCDRCGVAMEIAPEPRAPAFDLAA